MINFIDSLIIDSIPEPTGEQRASMDNFSRKLKSIEMRKSAKK